MGFFSKAFRFTIFKPNPEEAPVRFFLAGLLIFSAGVANSHEITTNAVFLHNAPEWLKRVRVSRVINRIQSKLEWTTRRIHAYYYSNSEEFGRSHGLGPKAVAVTKSSSKGTTMHLGPKITDKNFDHQFGHEMVHVIVYQKYRGAIPKWLEEGLANHLSKAKKVDYKWLIKQGFPKDVRQLAHPFQGSSAKILYRYKASQALAEMLDKKCDLENLIRLSVERKMENYIRTYCEIKDLNTAFKEWVEYKATGKKKKKNKYY